MNEDEKAVLRLAAFIGLLVVIDSMRIPGGHASRPDIRRYCGASLHA